jgi:hypothetical protein
MKTGATYWTTKTSTIPYHSSIFWIRTIGRSSKSSVINRKWHHFYLLTYMSPLDNLYMVDVYHFKLLRKTNPHPQPCGGRPPQPLRRANHCLKKWFFKWFNLINWSFFTNGHVHLTKGTKYVFFNQSIWLKWFIWPIHLVKLNHLSQNGQWVLVKWNI